MYFSKIPYDRREESDVLNNPDVQVDVFYIYHTGNRKKYFEIGRRNIFKLHALS